MEEKNITGKKQTVWQLTSSAWSQMLSRLDLIGWYLVAYVGVMLAMAAIALAAFFAYRAGVAIPFIATMGFGLMLFWLVVNINAAAALLFAVVQPEKTSYWQGWRLAWPNVPGLIWLGLLTSCILLPGLMLFVVPGVILMVYLLLTQIIFAKERLRGFDAMARSVELVRGCWWSTLGRFAFLMLFAIALSIVTGILESIIGKGDLGEFVGMAVGLVLQSALAVFVLFFLYGWYEEREKEVPLVASSLAPARRWLKIGVWAGVAITILLPLLAAAVGWTFFKDDLLRWYINEQLETQFEPGAGMYGGQPMNMNMRIEY